MYLFVYINSVCVYELSGKVSLTFTQEHQTNTRHSLGEMNEVCGARADAESAVSAFSKEAVPHFSHAPARYTHAYMRVRFRQSFNEERQTREWRPWCSIKLSNAAGAHPAVKTFSQEF